ncbi:helix-turn-helix transcriptional regulator [Methylobacterium sp. 22177]|uniref:helix-turn-helix transcriptional regulator n=1 Tax=Methylobacterium sp. 22177 TaxID=3453885 RepID=UPI003F87CEFD
MQQKEFVSTTEVMKKLSISRNTLLKMVATGKFPQPLRLTEKTLRWREQVVSDWVANMEREAECAVQK